MVKNLQAPNWLFITSIILLITCVAQLFSQTNSAKFLEYQLGLDVLFQIRGARPAPDNVTIFDIDSQLLKDANIHNGSQPLKYPCPENERVVNRKIFSRCLLANVISEISAKGAEQIVMDVSFEQPSDPDADQALISAIREAGNVLVLRIIESSVHTDSDTYEYKLNSIYGPIEEVVVGSAPFPLPKLGNKIRQFWVVYDAMGPKITLPTLAWLQSRKYELREEKGRGAVLPSAYNSVDDTTSLQMKAESRILNYYGPPGTIDTRSALKVFEAAPHQELKGKTVFVGLAEQNKIQKTDGFRTVFSTSSGLDLSGVEIAATAYLNLLNDDHILAIGWKSSFIMYLLCAFAIIIVYRIEETSKSLPLVIAFHIFILCGSLLCFTRFELLVPTIGPMVLLSGAYCCILVMQKLQASQKSSALAKILSFYTIPTQWKDWLKNRNHTAQPIKVNGICLVCDFVGYSNLANKLTATSLANHMNVIFESVFELAESFGGQIIDPGDDSFFIYWEDLANDRSINARKAVALAQSISDKLRDNANLYKLLPSISIVAGEFAVGAVGGKGKYATNLTGRIINLATRIEKLNRRTKTDILLTNEVASLLDPKETLYLGQFSFKGQLNFSRLFTILDLPPLASIASTEKFKQAFEKGVNYMEAERIEDAFNAFEQADKIFANYGPTKFYLQTISAPALPQSTDQSHAESIVGFTN